MVKRLDQEIFVVSQFQRLITASARKKIVNISGINNETAKTFFIAQIFPLFFQKRAVFWLVKNEQEMKIIFQNQKFWRDRLAQKIKINYDVIVNIQGDEPCINPKQIEQIISLFDNDTTQIGTLAKKIKDIKIITDKNNPKAIFDTNGVALNFCRTITNAIAEKEYFKLHPVK